MARWVAVAGLAVALVVAAGLVVNYRLSSGSTSPASIFVGNDSRVSPGTIGCRSTADELCFAIQLGTAESPLRLANIRFAVTNQTNQSSVSPDNPRVPLGDEAAVSVLQSPTVMAGVWNWSGGDWTNGSDWTFPTNEEVTVIFDSDLPSSVSLNDTIFWMIASGPFSGAAGTYLY